jgi:transposase
LLRELGLTIPAGATRVVPAVRALGEPGHPTALPDPLRAALADAAGEIEALELRIRALERSLEQLAAQSPLVARLRSVPGVGLLTATALVAFVGDVARFPSGRLDAQLA